MSMLRIEGEVDRPTAFGAGDLAVASGQVADVSAVVPGRSGRAVRLEALLRAAGLRDGATHLSLVSTDGFAASAPLAALRHGVVLYASPDGSALAEGQGGPFRFLVPEAEGCSLDDVSHCTNVKRLSVLRLTAGPGTDTRPRSEDEHEALHARERHRRG
ncbi:MAG: molybdopterin-dependent oxidoreductase [Alphaproteobacteria bacterium]